MNEQLRISPNKRRLLHEDGRPFFYLADTAWHLFHLIPLEEAKHFLTIRAEQNYNVIQAVALCEADGVRTPNTNGDLALEEMDPTRPNEAYFAHIDRVMEFGASKGIWSAFLPTWGDKWNNRWGIGPEIFTPENARIYGEWIGKRYRDLPVIWVLGGDRQIENARHLEINRAMAEGIRAGDGGNHLMTYHPCGGTTSAQFVHDEPWLDFNMLQSGHQTARLSNQCMIQADYARNPVKPCLDGEPVYDDHPDITFKRDLPAPYFGELVARRAAYQAVFAGACGHTYGCHDIWQFFDGEQPGVNRARTPWKEAVHLPAAGQMRHLRSLMESVPFEYLLPDPNLASAAPSGEPVQAMRTEDGSIALVYFPTQGTRSVQLCALDGAKFDTSWFDPRTGAGRDGGKVATESYREFTPPAGGPDWVLILEKSSRLQPAS